MEKNNILLVLFLACFGVLSTATAGKMEKTSSDKRFMVIDLSSGPKGTSYPISYLDKEPAGGWDDIYRTRKIVLRKVEANTFRMGSPKREIGHRGNEYLHNVTLSEPYYIGIFEITQGQWERVTGSNPSAFKGADRPVEQVTFNMIRGDKEGTRWPDSPAVDPGSFIGILRARTGIEGVDLPTEAQWECACRAGTQTALSSGKNLTNRQSCRAMDEVGRYKFNRNDGKGSHSEHAKVGSYAPNAWGIYDMHGNVYEWCLDWDPNRGARTDVKDPLGQRTGKARSLRSSAFDHPANCCRSAFRDARPPEYKWNNVGFRIVLRGTK